MELPSFKRLNEIGLRARFLTDRKREDLSDKGYNKIASYPVVTASSNA